MTYQIRFHLGRGTNFRKFQIRFPDGETKYYSPDEHQILMHNCRLHNRPQVAASICAGRNKTVCAWIVCESFEILPPHTLPLRAENQIFYNPKVKPYWVDPNNNNLDNENYSQIATQGRNIFLK